MQIQQEIRNALRENLKSRIFAQKIQAVFSTLLMKSTEQMRNELLEEIDLNLGSITYGEYREVIASERNEGAMQQLYERLGGCVAYTAVLKAK